MHEGAKRVSITWQGIFVRPWHTAMHAKDEQRHAVERLVESEGVVAREARGRADALHARLEVGRCRLTPG
jgi:hypothetical protein